MLINLDGLKKRREFAMVAFVNDVITQRINSPEILANSNLYAPIRSLRNRNLFDISNQRTNYGKNEPRNRMMSCNNQTCESINKTTLTIIFFFFEVSKLRMKCN